MMHAPIPKASEYRFLTGDCLAHLKTFNDNSIDCVVTSPPYFGLRDYGTASWVGGDPACKHEGDQRWYTTQSAAKSEGCAEAFSKPGPANALRLKEARWRERGVCIHCGAEHRDQQIGLEQTPADFVNKLVEVFSEVRRVFKPSGTCWLNLGDSYAGSWGAQSHEHAGKHAPNVSALSANQVKAAQIRSSNTGSLSRTPGLKSKDLIGIPWRVAFALQASGWYLRQDIIWHKPNPMPESVRDRCTKAHEYLFMLTKSEKYFYDADAIAEEAVGAARVRKDRFGGNKHDGNTTKHSAGSVFVNAKTRNRRSVWTIATKPFKEAHFATFPPDLVEPCILAGCPQNGIVLDPFSGAGTTVLVAHKLNRHAIGIELNPAYNEIAERRLQTSRNCGT